MSAAKNSDHMKLCKFRMTNLK